MRQETACAPAHRSTRAPFRWMRSYIVECVTEIQKGPAALPALNVLRRIATVHDSSVGAKVNPKPGCF